MKLFHLFLLIASAGPAVAQGVTTVPPVSYSEDTVDRLKSSSDLVVGAVFVGGEKLPDVPRFRAKTGASMGGTRICLRTRSVDGFYQGMYDYMLPDGATAGTILDFDYPTGFIDLVSAPPDDDFAIAAYLGSCASDLEEIFVGFWNTVENTEADEVILTLNTVGGTAAHVFVGEDLSAPPVDCRKLDAPRTNGFDFVCELPIPAETDGLVELEIQVRRGTTRDKARYETLRIVR